MGIAGQPVGWFYHRKAEDMFVALESEEPKEAVRSMLSFYLKFTF